MAFSYTTLKQGMFGNLKFKVVSYTNTLGSTGGHIPKAGLGMTWIDFSYPTTETSEATTSPLIKKNRNSGDTAQEAGSILLTTVADEDGTLFIVGE
jgi:hypothetical protein